MKNFYVRKSETNSRRFTGKRSKRTWVNKYMRKTNGNN